MPAPPAQSNVFDFLFNRGGIPLTIPLGPTPCNVYPACPVGSENRTGVKSDRYFTGACPACLLAKSDRIGADRIDLLNRGDAIPLGVQLFFKQGSHKAPLTHKEGGAFLFYLRRVTLAMSLLKERINLWG